MPRGDGTGPAGMGRLTGRGLGFCAGYAQPGFVTAPGGWGRGGGFGLGRGWGRGQGAGWGRRWAGQAAPMGVPPVQPPVQAAMSVDQELALLRNQAEQLAASLDAIQQRIDQLASAPEE